MGRKRRPDHYPGANKRFNSGSNWTSYSVSSTGKLTRTPVLLPESMPPHSSQAHFFRDFIPCAPPSYCPVPSPPALLQSRPLPQPASCAYCLHCPSPPSLAPLLPPAAFQKVPLRDTTNHLTPPNTLPPQTGIKLPTLITLSPSASYHPPLSFTPPKSMLFKDQLSRPCIGKVLSP